MKTNSVTQNVQFEKQGFLLLKAFEDVAAFKEKPGKQKGKFSYEKNMVIYQEQEEQVKGCLARYNHPKYALLHAEVGKKLEKILGKALYRTYYCDRFYFPGQELKKHTDRPACEISVTLHLETNLKGAKAKWPIYVETPDEQKCSLSLSPGDALVYKGCERPHWRLPMPNQFKWFSNEDIYYHQIFLHYVLQDGLNAHFAFDKK